MNADNQEIRVYLRPSAVPLDSSRLCDLGVLCGEIFLNRPACERLRFTVPCVDGRRPG